MAFFYLLWKILEFILEVSYYIIRYNYIKGDEIDEVIWSYT